MNEQYFLDDSLVRLLLKKKRQRVKRFYRSGTFDAENITAAFTSKNIFTRISGDNRRGECHILLDCSGSTTMNPINDNKGLYRIHLIGACGLQMARYLSRFFKVKMSLFKDAPLKNFDVPKSLLPEQFANILYNSIDNTEKLSAFLNRDGKTLNYFTGSCGNDAPLAIRESIKELEKNNTKSLIVAICDGDPYATCNRDSIDKMAEFQKKHTVVFSVIDNMDDGNYHKNIAEKFEREHNIKTALTSDKDAAETGGGMVINNTLLKIHESLSQASLR